MDTGDYLSGQETKVDTFPDAVDIEPVSDEQPLSTEAADLGGAGGVVWDQYAGKALLSQLVVDTPVSMCACVQKESVCVCVCH